MQALSDFKPYSDFNDWIEWAELKVYNFASSIQKSKSMHRICEINQVLFDKHA